MKSLIAFSIAFLSLTTMAFSQTIAGGSGHTLLICPGSKQSLGGLQTWGFNYYGQLGNGNSGINEPLPASVNGVSGLSAVSGGAMHSILLEGNGQVITMGENDRGQLGTGNNDDSYVPVSVPGLSNITAISAGWEHSLALKNDGTVWAWGYNAYGQLGTGDTIYHNAPVQVAGLTGITGIAAGRHHSLAIGANGTVWVWGWNPYGQLGDNTTANSLTAIQVPGLTGVIAVGGGDGHSIALKNDGTVWAWGFNVLGQIGQGNWSFNVATPTQVMGVSNILSISSGRFHNVALKSDGTVWTWGSNAYGEMGDGTTDDALSPIQLAGLSNVSEIAAGDEYTLVLKNDGTVWGLGLNGSGQIGNGTMWNQIMSPEPATGPCTAHQTTTGLAEEEILVSVYPNPATDELTVIAENAVIENVVVYTADGRICTSSFDMVTGTVNVKGLATGSYYATIGTKTGNSKVKFVKL
ncbi:MAG TPA: T9SS type A sorting domain-containing protein [Fluviicola sp.]|nr:T9SS type A sorting domain-containing protein [Fluviicola sp.]